MTRSALASQRRRALADAAAGQYPAPVSVALYLRAATVVSAKTAMPQLIAHAKARHWVIIGSITDFPHAPAVTGPSGWARVQDLVASGQCTGVVAGIDAAVREDVTLWHDQALSWLKDHGAFLATPSLDTRTAER